MSIEKFFEDEIILEYSLDSVWNIFSDIEQLSKWHPLMKKENNYENIFIQKINDVDKKFIICITEKKEKSFLCFSIRPSNWETDYLHNTAEFTFTELENSRTKIKYTRWYIWDVELENNVDKKKQRLISSAQNISTSIKNLKI
jgi:hypothetical protein